MVCWKTFVPVFETVDWRTKQAEWQFGDSALFVSLAFPQKKGPAFPTSHSEHGRPTSPSLPMTRSRSVTRLSPGSPGCTAVNICALVMVSLHPVQKSCLGHPAMHASEQPTSLSLSIPHRHPLIGSPDQL